MSKLEDIKAGDKIMLNDKEVEVKEIEKLVILKRVYKKTIN